MYKRQRQCGYNLGLHFIQWFQVRRLLRFHLQDVIAELGLDHIGILARLQSEGCRFKRRHGHPALDHSQPVSYTHLDAKTDAAARQKAEDLLKQIKGGADFAQLAKANSDDPGSKEQGGELGMIQRGVTVKEFENAAFGLQPGQYSDVVKTQFGYHILQVEAKQTAHLKPLDEVKAQIVATLTRQQEAEQEASYAQQLATEAAKTSLAKTAEAHHMQVVTTDYVEQNACLLYTSRCV